MTLLNGSNEGTIPPCDKQSIYSVINISGIEKKYINL